MARPRLTKALIVTAIIDIIDDTLRSRVLHAQQVYLNAIRQAVPVVQRFLQFDPQKVKAAMGPHYQRLLWSDDLGPILPTTTLDVDTVWPSFYEVYEDLRQRWEKHVRRRMSDRQYLYPYVALDMPSEPAVCQGTMDVLNTTLAIVQAEADGAQGDDEVRPDEFHTDLMRYYGGTIQHVVDTYKALDTVYADASKLQMALLSATNHASIRTWEQVENQAPMLIPYMEKNAEQPTSTDLESLIACVREGGDCN